MNYIKNPQNAEAILSNISYQLDVLFRVIFLFIPKDGSFRNIIAEQVWEKYKQETNQ